MRAAGASKLRIAGAVLLLLTLLLTVVVAGGETVAVSGERRAQSVLVRSGGGGLELVGSGLWAREGRDLLHARTALLEAGDSLRLRDLRLLRLDEEGRLRELWTAQAAIWRDGTWTLLEVRRIVFAEDHLEDLREAVAVWPSELDPNLLRLGAIRPRYMPVAELRAQIEYFERNELDAGEYRAALWSRVFYPLNVLAMCLCALPFAFSSPRGVGFGRNLFFGVVLGIGFWLAQRALVNLAQVYGFDLAAMSGLPALVFGAAGIAWLRRGR
jgi:lipopolysaccharide export system permease protein